MLNNCGISGDMATALLSRLDGGRDISLLLSENPLESGSTDWIDLIEGNHAPRKLHLDMIQFEHQRNFHRLITALTQNKTIEFLSMVGTGPPTGADSEMSEILFNFFKLNDTLQFLDLSGYSGKLEESHMGWSLSGAISGLMQNRSLLQLRIRNHDLGAAEDVTELCRVLATNEKLAMLDCQNNNFDHNQFGKIVHALHHNHHLISFPLSEADRDYALQEEKRRITKTPSQSGRPPSITLSKLAESRLNGSLKWLKGYWETEVKRIKEIIRRNRDSFNKDITEFDSEYLEAWEDEGLSSWLTQGQKIPSSSEEQKHLSVVSLDVHSRAPSPVPSIPAINLGDPYSASDPTLSTYTIEEESSASNRTSLYKTKSHQLTTLLQDGGSTTSLPSSIKVTQPEVDDLTLDNW